MFQDTALLSYLTVYETLAAFRALYQDPDDLERIIDVCHLSDIRNRFNDKISGGQRQRLLLALALINQPELLFLDEPSTGLDPQARRYLWEIINVVKKSGKTIILTTHYMEEAQQMCDQVAIMDQGKIIVQGTPKQLVSQYTRGPVIHLGSDCLNKISGAIPFEHYQEQEKTTIQVQDMNHAVRTLLDLGVDLSHMDVELPNLETVFLNLTGRRLRD
jgi:ABC-2 type transport system ATP-binding protein